MNNVFTYSAPFLHYDLTKESKKEFQIKYNVNNEFLESYYESNKKTFLECVYAYIKEKYSDVVRKQGIDFHYNEDERYTHIYVHLDLNNSTNQVIQKIVDDLDDQYRTNWIKFRVPKLMTIIKNKLRTNHIFHDALQKYQFKHGKDDTDKFLHVYTQQIKWYYDDISFCTKRNKFDFQ